MSDHILVSNEAIESSHIVAVAARELIDFDRHERIVLLCLASGADAALSTDAMAILPIESARSLASRLDNAIKDAEGPGSLEILTPTQQNAGNA